VPAKYLRNYVSVPQPGLDGRTSPVYSAAVVGGGTVVNGMFFNRGSAGDYDAWEQLGNPGWAWKDLLPYFKKVVSSIMPMALILTPLAIRARPSLLHPRIWQTNTPSPVICPPMEKTGPLDPVFRITNIPSSVGDLFLFSDVF